MIFMRFFYLKRIETKANRKIEQDDVGDDDVDADKKKSIWILYTEFTLSHTHKDIETFCTNISITQSEHDERKKQ